MSTISKINGLKAGALALILAGSTVMYASNPKKYDTNPNQTEIVSREGAEALKVMNIQKVQQTSVPTIHNSRLDNTFRKFATNEEEKIAINDIINSFYKDKGTFLASALIQHELDRQQLFLLLEEKGNLLTKKGLNPELGKNISEYGSNFYKSVRPAAKKIDNWLDNNYTPKVLGLLYFDHKPSAKEVVEKLDNIAEKKANFNLDDIIDYHTCSDGFKNKSLKNRTDDKAMSELIAYKIFTIDKIIFKKTLENNDVFGRNSYFTKYERLADFYNSWMGTVEPNGK